ncbi:MAG: hypothetical protein OEN01_00485, partial [Candidatus Krumholzibacteria bacterium]|nr:hypothetical protein [Candidatus Krumholzibacteria bacterium]
MGLCVSPVAIVTETLLQVETPEAFRGRIFSTREILTKTAFLITSFLATLANAFVGKDMIMVAVGVFLAVMGVLLLRKKFLKA